jgi:hypothetical protein
MTWGEMTQHSSWLSGFVRAVQVVMGDSVVSALIWARSSRSGLGARAVRALLQAAAMPKSTSLPDAVKKFGQSCHLPGASREACCWDEWG